MDYSKQAESILPYLIRQESGGNPNAVSPKGAFGLGQTMPGTARDPGYGVTPMRDNSPQEQRRIARDYLAAMLNKYSGDSRLALAAYNAGPGNVDNYHGVPPFKETRNYVSRILGAMGVGSAEAADSPRNYPGEGLQGGDPASFGAVPVDEPQGGDPADFGAVPVDDGPAPLSPEVQTGIRSTVRGLSSPLSFLIDAGNAPYNLAARGVNAIRPGTMDYLPMGHDYVDYGLQSMGVNPEAQSTAEKAVTAGLGAITGAGVSRVAPKAIEAGYDLARRGINAIRPKSIPEVEALPRGWYADTVPAQESVKFFGSAPGQQAVAAATASAASNAAHDAGLPWWAEMGAGFAGGFGGSAAMGMAEGVGRGTGRALNTLSESGQEKAAGRILARGTTAPNQAIERLENPELRREFQAGNRPWSVEITQDAGQIAQMRALENSDIGKKAMVGNMRDVRKSESDAAVTDALNRLGGRHGGGGRGDPITQIAELKRDAVRGFRGEKDLSLMQADGTLPGRQIIALREEHQGDSAIMRYLNGIERRIGGGPISFQELWNARKEVDNQLYKVWKDAAPESKKVLAGAGKQLRTAMNAALLEADPTFAPFLRRYSRLSAAEDRLRLGRELGDSLKNSGRRMVTNSADAVGDSAISAAKAGRLESKLYDVADELTPMGERLTKGQRGILESVFREKERNAWLDKTDTQSATAPYLAEGKMIAEDIANAALGTRPGEGAGVIRSLTELVGGRPVDLALRHLEPAIGKKLARAYQNPEYMAKLLRLANDRQAPTLRGIAGNLGRTGSLAEFYGMLGR